MYSVRVGGEAIIRGGVDRMRWSARESRGITENGFSVVSVLLVSCHEPQSILRMTLGHNGIVKIVKNVGQEQGETGSALPQNIWREPRPDVHTCQLAGLYRIPFQTSYLRGAYSLERRRTQHALIVGE